MTPRPQVEPLPVKHRQWVFILSLLTFALAVPAFVFYAVGYRYDFSDEVRNIRAVGGMYISAETDEISIYVDGEPVEDMRIFQNAAYVQNLDAGLHQVHVQGEDLQTWVKTLPVYAHFVTEGGSFNLPERPQIRLITPYQTTEGQSVLIESATSTFSFASTTGNWIATSSTATSSFDVNPEFTYVSSLIASTTEKRTLLTEQVRLQKERFRFGSATSSVLATTSATTTIESRNIMLYEDNGEVIAKWIGNDERVPYYYCVDFSGEEATAFGYGSHVMEDLKEEYGTTTDFSDPDLFGQRLCRNTIRIDRKWQSVQYFDFLPGSGHHVLLQLQDGVYVVEIDDRAWQNVQLLYPGDYLEVVVDGERIYIKDGEYIMEVFTELQE